MSDGDNYEVCFTPPNINGNIGTVTKFEFDDGNVEAPVSLGNILPGGINGQFSLQGGAPCGDTVRACDADAKQRT